MSDSSDTKIVTVTKNPDGTVTTKVWPGRGVVAVAALLRAQYIAEYETDAPLADWFPQAIEVVNTYLEAEGIA